MEKFYMTVTRSAARQSVKCHCLYKTLQSTFLSSRTQFPEVQSQNVGNTLALTLPDMPVMSERIFYSMPIVCLTHFSQLLKKKCAESVLQLLN